MSKVVNPYELQEHVNTLVMKIRDLNTIIAGTEKSSSVFALNDLKKQREKYKISLRKAALRLWGIEQEATQVAEWLKLQVPGYLGVPCSDYRVPSSLIKYCKMDYKEN